MKVYLLWNDDHYRELEGIFGSLEKAQAAAALECEAEISWRKCETTSVIPTVSDEWEGAFTLQRFRPDGSPYDSRRQWYIEEWEVE